jgi:transcriptional regulator with XRE-family HTH domain
MVLAMEKGPHSYYQRLGQRLREQRQLRGFTQQELAEKAGLTTAFLSYLENGSRKGSLDAYLALGQALGLKPETLLGGGSGGADLHTGEPSVSLGGLSPGDTRAVRSVVRSLRKKPKA